MTAMKMKFRFARTTQEPPILTTLLLSAPARAQRREAEKASGNLLYKTRHAPYGSARSCQCSMCAGAV